MDMYVCVLFLDPPDVSITGFKDDWHIGLEGAELKCASEGNPKPTNFTWSR